MIGAKVAVEPEKSLIAARAVDFVARNEFDLRSGSSRRQALERDQRVVVSKRERRDRPHEDRHILDNMDALPLGHAGLQARPSQSRTISVAI